MQACPLVSVIRASMEREKRLKASDHSIVSSLYSLLFLFPRNKRVSVCVLSLIAFGLLFNRSSSSFSLLTLSSSFKPSNRLILLIVFSTKFTKIGS